MKTSRIKLNIAWQAHIIGGLNPKQPGGAIWLPAGLKSRQVRKQTSIRNTPAFRVRIRLRNLIDGLC